MSSAISASARRSSSLRRWRTAAPSSSSAPRTSSGWSRCSIGCRWRAGWCMRIMRGCWGMSGARQRPARGTPIDVSRRSMGRPRVYEQGSASAAEQRTIARILKVNHAGEYGAIRIYRAQAWVARWLYPDVVGFLEQTLQHEIRHYSLFQTAMQARGARPCRVMSLWGNGGLVLGFLTALMGRQGIWICTAAVEAAVHRHLDDQLEFLRRRDAELAGLIQSIQGEELSHLEHARARIA